MNRPIVVPLDGSSFAARAIPVAASVAKRSGASIHLVRVHPTASASGGFMIGGSAQTTVVYEDRRLRTTATRYLDDATDSLRGELGEGRVISALLEGPVGTALTTYSEQQRAALVVMASRRRGLLASVLEASTAEQVLRSSGIPLLVVGKAREDDDAVASATFDRILVPVDGTELSAEVLEHALSLGVKDRTRYTLVRVVPPGFVEHESQPAFPRIDSTIWETDLGEEAALDLARRAAEVRARGYGVEVRLEPSTRPAEAIVRIAQEIDADLIALTTRPRRFATRLLFGSVAAHVVKHSTSPALVYCPRGAEEVSEVVHARVGSAKESLTVAR